MGRAQDAVRARCSGNIRHSDDVLARLVYGSNMIESAGTCLDITRQLCWDVFQGRETTAEIDKTDDKYQKHKEYLQANRRPDSHEEVVRSRREVIQHAQAFRHMFEHIVKKKEPWSEALIRETHRILHSDLDDEVQAGQYREYEVAVKYEKPGEKKAKAHLCMRAKSMSQYMKDMVEHLNRDIAGGEQAGWFDPFTLAARYHHQFVNIHPFGDGNGRMSRIILNALLLRFAGAVSVFGVDAEERDKYIGIATTASKAFQAEDMEVAFEEHTGHLELAKFILAKAEKWSLPVPGQCPHEFGELRGGVFCRYCWEV